ncbi:hypothetical protein H632_c323p1 [Helicosporidium sp. ATCC 50920]|nr:hypothetical protein H632_c323p1 [Helicosporidium sp. ATCC 50920]|eukprot:KDD76184.1 hypothetical protein H632_c323p1 [Helicosporidium sp. ATCC 50920]
MTSGIQTDAAALNELAEYMTTSLNIEDVMERIVDYVDREVPDRRLTAEILREILNKSPSESLPSSDGIAVIDAFSVPRVSFDPVRRMFYATPGKPSVFGSIESKIQLYKSRYHMILQRLSRNPSFRSLVELKSLLGRFNEPAIVCGFLSQPQPDEFALEDLSARVRLDLAEAEPADGYFTENSIVVAEGTLTASNVFRVSALGLPPAEPTAQALRALAGLDTFGAADLAPQQQAAWAAAHPADRVVMLSDVWLDCEALLVRLQRVLMGYAACGSPPSCVALAGNFLSPPARRKNAAPELLVAGMARLAKVLDAVPELRAATQFVVIPGPEDIGPSLSLPRPPLMPSLAAPLTAAHPNVRLGSNPCRARVGDRRVVFFRADLASLVAPMALIPPGEAGAGAEAAGRASGSEEEGSVPASLARERGSPVDEAFRHLVASVMQQAHLCPVPLEVAPVVWEHDQALHLYPAPDALFLADCTPAAEHLFDACVCINPGPFYENSFGAYNVAERVAELCDVPENEFELASDDGRTTEEVEDQPSYETLDLVVEPMAATHDMVYDLIDT